MVRKIFCDICGKEINCHIITRIDSSHHVYAVDRCREFCPSCAKKVYRFIDREKWKSEHIC